MTNRYFYLISNVLPDRDRRNNGPTQTKIHDTGKA